jgi:exosortase
MMSEADLVLTQALPAAARRERFVWWMLGAAGATLVVPTLWDLGFGRWASESQGHELLFVATASFLLYRRRSELIDEVPAVQRKGAAVLFMLALLVYVLGRSQQLLRAEIFSLITLLGCGMWMCGRRRALRAAAFPLFFMLFVVPLPYSWVLTITGPLKLAVSAVAAHLLQGVGFPVGRSGVVVTIGQYQLLVSEACAGLQTMFTLEATGLLYAHLSSTRLTFSKPPLWSLIGDSPQSASVEKRHESRQQVSWMSIVLAVAVIPISFTANVVRVVVLMLVTYFFGDEVGQGFVHGFAGLVLFGVALAMMFGTDCLLGRWFGRRVS